MFDVLPKTQFFMQMAQLTSQRSKCHRLQVGCVLTDLSHELIVIGYNGGYKGGPNGCLGDPTTPGKCGCVHAEANALTKAFRGDKIAYVTHAPCLTCATMLINADVREVHYGDQYRHSEGTAVLEEAGVTVIHEVG